MNEQFNHNTQEILDDVAKDLEAESPYKLDATIYERHTSRRDIRDYVDSSPITTQNSPQRDVDRFSFEEKRNFTTQKKPRLFKAIITSLLGLVIFGLVYLLSYLIIGGIIYILSLIPLVSHLVNWLFQMRGDSPDIMLSILAPTLAYVGTMAAQESINKDKHTRGISCMILGICIMTLHIVSLVLNILYSEGFLGNITQAIAGFAIFNSGRGKIEESKES